MDVSSNATLSHCVGLIFDGVSSPVAFQSIAQCGSSSHHPWTSATIPSTYSSTATVIYSASFICKYVVFSLIYVDSLGWHRIRRRRVCCRVDRLDMQEPHIEYDDALLGLGANPEGAGDRSSLAVGDIPFYNVRLASNCIFSNEASQDCSFQREPI
jgi:hypothetical protein